jgi:hypothetical protein
MNNTLGIEYAYTRIHKLEVEALAYKDKIAELNDIVSVLTIADETGYVDGEGFVIGFNQITDEAREFLAKHTLEQRAIGFEAAIDAALDLGLIENDTNVCNSIREQASKGGAE